MKNNPKKESRALISSKGFSFTFDALVAVFVFVGVMAFVSINTSSYATYSSQELAKIVVAQDMLDLSVDLNKLQSYDANTIETFYASIIPVNYKYQLQIDRYSYTGSVFSLVSSTKYGDTNQVLTQIPYVESKKVFLTFNSASPPDINYLNTAKLRVWVRQQ